MHAVLDNSVYEESKNISSRSNMLLRPTKPCIRHLELSSHIGQTEEQHKTQYDDFLEDLLFIIPLQPVCKMESISEVRFHQFDHQQCVIETITVFKMHDLSVWKKDLQITK